MYDIFEKLCKEKGVSAYRVSKATGISTATLSDWKTGKSLYVVSTAFLNFTGHENGHENDFAIKKRAEPKPCPYT